MLFRDVIGQTAIKQQLVELVQQNRLSHALLFLGKEGAGALPMALAFANYVSLLPDQNADASASLFGEPVAVQLPATADAADEWMLKQPAFSKAAELIHPDIHYSYPVVTKKPNTPPLSADYATEWREFISQFPYANVYDWLQFIGAENKQGNITANECNDIIRKLSLKSFESRYKILVMWMPEYLGKEGNKLLKLIEEPPADTLFILVAENESQILSTIISRCQLVKIPALAASDIEQKLINSSNLAPEQAKMLSNASDGSYREALQLLNHADEDFMGMLREWLNSCFRNNVHQLVKTVDEISRLGRERQKQFLRHFTHIIEQSLRMEVTGADAGNFQLGMSAAEAEFAARINKVMDLSQKEAVANELNDASYFIERNANAKILFHALSIKIHHILKNKVLVQTS